MKTFLLLATAASALILGGCVSSGPGPSYSGQATAVIGEDDYMYYPGSEVYYSPAHRYYYYRDGGAWVHRPEPPRAWVRDSVSVNVHLHDAPERNHPAIVKQYPHNWHAPDKDHDGHDARHDRDDHDRDRH